jgi:hypothetical protein
MVIPRMMQIAQIIFRVMLLMLSDFSEAHFRHPCEL